MQYRILGTVILSLSMMTGTVLAQNTGEQELMVVLFADIGMTEMELMQFAAKVEEIAKPYGQLDEAKSVNAPKMTRDNYVEKVDDYFEKFLQPMFQEVRATAADSLTEDQYSKMILRLYQVFEYFCEIKFPIFEFNAGSLVQLFLLPDVIPLTEEQSVELVALQKEWFTELAGLEITLKEEYADLFAERDTLSKELDEAETPGETTTALIKWGKVEQKTRRLMNESGEKFFAKMKDKLNAKLTTEQKVKLTQIVQDAPDYLKKMQPKERPFPE